MQVPIEDLFEDIIGKSMRGHGIDAATLSSKSGVPVDKIEELLDAKFDADAVRAISPYLELHADSVIAVAEKSWYPEAVTIDGLELFNTTYEDMTVNAYLVFDPVSKKAAVFDTGADASGIIARIEELGLEVETIFLTHTHIDHIVDLPKLRAAVGENVPVLVNQGEMFDGATGAINEGDTAKIGQLELSTFLTNGHAVAGNTYVIGGLSRPIAIIGDAIFSTSMGGGKVSFAQALETNRKAIFTLADETVLCPGHGPMTTVGEEKAHNPFFPEFK